MNRDDNTIWGFSVAVGETVQTAYTIEVTVDYDSGNYDGSVLQTLIRGSLYQLIDDLAMLGSDVNLALVVGACKHAGVVDVNVTTPANDLDGAPNRVHLCTKDETNVVITMVPV